MRWRGSLVGVVGIALCLVLLWQTGRAEPNEDVLETILRGMEYRDQNWTSGHGQAVSQTIIRTPRNREAVIGGAEPEFNVARAQMSVHEWWFDGDRMREECLVVVPRTGAGNARETMVSNDGMNMLISGDGAVVEVASASQLLYERFGNSVLASLGIGKHPADPHRPSLRDYEAKLAAWEILEGYRIARLVTIQPEGADDVRHEWWIAPDLGYLVLREEHQPKDWRMSYSQVFRVYEQDGVWMPGGKVTEPVC